MRAPHLHLHASLRLIGVPHVMRRPATVNMNNVAIENAPAEPIFKRDSSACPGNGWGACDCKPASGGFACDELPLDGKLVVPSCATSIPANAFSGCGKIKSFDLTQATNLVLTQSASLEHPTTCSDTDNGAKDKEGDNCAFYTRFGKSFCGGNYDDKDFKSDEMCCACGGGEHVAKSSTPQSAGTGFLKDTPNLVEVKGLDKLPGGVIPNEAFKGSGISSISIPKQITRIKASAFKGTANLRQELVLPATTTELGESAFEGSGITAVRAEAGAKLTSIAKFAFKMTEKLKTATLPPSIESIGESAFEGSTVETVAVSSNLKSIGKNAFKDAAKLTGFTLPAGVTIGGGAFTGAPDVKASSFTIDGVDVTSSCTAGATLS